MSLDNKEINCALCHAYLFPEDDVVYCPECGAPHHRECYNSIGHCALEEFHGTDKQYDIVRRAAEEEKIKKEEAEAVQTPDNVFNTPFGVVTNIDFLGGVTPDTVIDDGVTARDAAKFVFSNTMRFIPKFARGRKASWNWLAFLTPCGWFLSRKMYKHGLVAGVLQTIAPLFTIPFLNLMANLGIDITKLMGYDYAMVQKFMDNIDKISPVLLFAFFCGIFLNLAIMVLSGIFGDWFYRKHVINKVREINANSENKETDYRKYGGVNIFLFLIGFLTVRYLPTIIALLL